MFLYIFILFGLFIFSLSLSKIFWEKNFFILYILHFFCVDSREYIYIYRCTCCALWDEKSCGVWRVWRGGDVGYLGIVGVMMRGLVGWLVGWLVCNRYCVCVCVSVCGCWSSLKPTHFRHTCTLHHDLSIPSVGLVLFRLPHQLAHWRQIQSSNLSISTSINLSLQIDTGKQLETYICAYTYLCGFVCTCL